MFQSDRASLVDDCSGCPTTSRTADSDERVNAPVQEDRNITVTDAADRLDVGCISIYSIRGVYVASRAAENILRLWHKEASGSKQ